MSQVEHSSWEYPIKFYGKYTVIILFTRIIYLYNLHIRFFVCKFQR